MPVLRAGWRPTSLLPSNPLMGTRGCRMGAYPIAKLAFPLWLHYLGDDSSPTLLPHYLRNLYHCFSRFILSSLSIGPCQRLGDFRMSSRKAWFASRQLHEISMSRVWEISFARVTICVQLSNGGSRARELCPCPRPGGGSLSRMHDFRRNVNRTFLGSISGRKGKHSRGNPGELPRGTNWLSPLLSRLGKDYQGTEGEDILRRCQVTRAEKGLGARMRGGPLGFPRSQ